MAVTGTAPKPLLAGFRMFAGEVLNALFGNPQYSTGVGYVAKAGGGQTSATLLTGTINSVDTVATAADSVLLPPALPGKVLFVVNNGSNSMQVFGTSTDTINGVAAATGVAQGAGQSCVYLCTALGLWFQVSQAGTFTNISASGTLAVSGAATLSSTLAVTGDTTLSGNSTTAGYTRRSTANALTAAGTNRATALVLAKDTNNVTTAAAGTGVVLPAGLVGMKLTIFNAGANALQVYANGSDTIDTVAGATGVVLTNAKRCDYYCVAANTWISAQLGVVSA